jgi:hypothetical protein
MWINFFWASQQEAEGGTSMIDQIRPPYHPLLASGRPTARVGMTPEGAKAHE